MIIDVVDNLRHPLMTDFCNIHYSLRRSRFKTLEVTSRLVNLALIKRCVAPLHLVALVINPTRYSRIDYLSIEMESLAHLSGATPRA